MLFPSTTSADCRMIDMLDVEFAREGLIVDTAPVEEVLNNRPISSRKGQRLIFGV